MSSISLKVETFAGTTIEEACRDLCALADRVGILCEVGFNGVKVWAYPGTDAAQLVKAWGEQMKRPAHVYRIAAARPADVRGTGRALLDEFLTEAKKAGVTHLNPAPAGSGDTPEGGA